MATKTTTIKQEIEAGNAMMLPPAPGKCQICAKEHEPHLPHDACTMYYGFYMLNVIGREATRAEAMAHCSDEVKAYWTRELEARGIDINSTNVRGVVRKQKRREKMWGIIPARETTTE